MSGNRSLDEFAGDGTEADASPSEGPTEDRSAPPDRAGEPSNVSEPAPNEAGADVDRPASTYAWKPDGGPCAACGDRVEERWRDGDDWVCGDCKDW